MKTGTITICSLLLLLLVLDADAQVRRAPPGVSSAGAELPAAYRGGHGGSRQPLFIENRGQWDPRARFLLKGNGLDMWVTDHGVIYDLFRVEEAAEPLISRYSIASVLKAASLEPAEPADTKRSGHVVSMRFEGTTAVPAARGTDLQSTRYNYFLGNDPARWATDVRLYRGARIERLYNGVDALFYLDEGRPRYDLVVAPGADPNAIRMKFDGATDVGVADNGALRIATSMGVLEQRGLYAYQEIDGRREEVRCEFQAKDDGTVTFRTGRFDRSRALVIDPLVYSTFLGGPAGGSGYAVTSDADGNIYVTGYTNDNASTFPISSGAYDGTYNGAGDLFLTKIDPDLTGSSQILYSTYIGGTANDYGHAITTDASGDIYIAGRSNDAAVDFPTTTGAFDMTHNGGFDVVVVRIDPDASGSAQLAYSTFVGGNVDEIAQGIAVDGDGNIHVTGFTNDGTTDYPTTIGAYDQSQNGQQDAFISRLDPSASGSAQLSYSTFLGGANIDIARAVAVDEDGLIHISGMAYDGTTDYPTTAGAYDISHNGAYDLFVTTLDPSASGSAQLVYSTYIGGTGGDEGFAIVSRGDGLLHVGGQTYDGATDFPTTAGAYDALHNGSADAVVLTLDPGASGSAQLVFATLLGGGNYEGVAGMAVDADGFIYTAGPTYDDNPDYPVTTGAYDVTPNGMADIYVSKLDPSASGSAQLVYSTFIGGTGNDWAYAAAFDADGAAYITGYSYHDEEVPDPIDYPTTAGAYDVTQAGSGTWNIIATKFATAGGPGTVTLTSPNGGESWCSGSAQNITWTSSNVDNLRIEISNDGGGTWSTLVSSVPAASGSYAWTIPAAQAGGTNYRIRLSEDGDITVVDASNASFTIIGNPVATISSSNASPTLGSTVQFTVAASHPGGAGSIAWLYLEFSNNGGASWGVAGAGMISTFQANRTMTPDHEGALYRARTIDNCGHVAYSNSIVIDLVDVANPVIGDTLYFDQPTVSHRDNSSGHIAPIGLRYGSTGHDLKGIQFIISVPNTALTVTSVELGSGINDPNDWSFDYDITTAASGMEIGVILFATTPGVSLPPGLYLDLVNVHYEVEDLALCDGAAGGDLTTAVMSIEDVESVIDDGMGSNGAVVVDPARAAVTATIHNSSSRGDVDCNDRVDVIDLSRMAKVARGRATFQSWQASRADMAPWSSYWGTPGAIFSDAENYGDGSINVQDLTLAADAIINGAWPDGLLLGRTRGSGGAIGAGPAPGVTPGGDALLLKAVRRADGIELRLVLDRPVSGLQFELQIPSGLDPGTARRGELLPAGASFGWRGEEGVLRGLLYSPSAEPLPPGEFLLLTIPATSSDDRIIALLDGIGAGMDEEELGIRLERVDARISGVATDRAERMVMAVAPSPATSDITVAYRLEHASTVTMRLIDALGRQVGAPLEAVGRSAGEHRQVVDIGSLPAGSYYCELAFGNQRRAIRFEVRR